MTPAEFKERMEKLLHLIGWGLQYYKVWIGLRFHEEQKVGWSLEEQNRAAASFNAFFVAVSSAALDMALLQFAKVFDTDSRTASLTILMRAAKADAKLVPHTTPSELVQASKALDQSKKLVTELKRRRNQEVVHADASPAPPISNIKKKDFDQLIERIDGAFQVLHRGHHNSKVDWRILVSEVDRDTLSLLEVLVAESRASARERV